MYVYTYICMYTYTYVCMYIYTYVCHAQARLEEMYAELKAWDADARECIARRILLVCVYVCICACMYVSVCVCVWMYMLYKSITHFILLVCMYVNMYI